jgi:hypothetical protein
VQSALRHQSHLLRRNPCRSRQTSRPVRAPRRFWIDRRPSASPASLVPVRFRSERAGHVTLDRPWGNAAPRPVASSGVLVLGHGQHEKLVPALPMDSGVKRPLSSHGLVLADALSRSIQVDDRCGAIPVVVLTTQLEAADTAYRGRVYVVWKGAWEAIPMLASRAPMTTASI